MDALPESCAAGPGSPARCSPDAAPPPAPRAVLAFDAPAACSDISDNQLLAITDTASLTADQLDRRHHLLRHRCGRRPAAPGGPQTWAPLVPGWLVLGWRALCSESAQNCGRGQPV